MQKKVGDEMSVMNSRIPMTSIAKRWVNEEDKGGLRGSPLINCYISIDITRYVSLKRETWKINP